MRATMTSLILTAMLPGPPPPTWLGTAYMDSAGLVRLARLGSWVSEKRVLVSGLESGLGDALVLLSCALSEGIRIQVSITSLL